MGSKNTSIPQVADLQSIYDQYNAAIRSKQFAKAAAFVTKELKTQLAPAGLSREEKDQLEEMVAVMVPVSYTVDHQDIIGSKAALYITATLNDPEIKGKTYRIEMMITFAKMAKAWKLGGVTYQMNPDTIKRSADQKYEPQTKYNFDKNTSMGGRIVSVSFEKKHTLVVMRMLDEENLVFLPDKASLEKSGLKTDMLAPWAILQVNGHPHRSNPYKIWGEQAEFVEPVLA